MSFTRFQTQLDSENEVELCHEKYESDEESENESIQVLELIFKAEEPLMVFITVCMKWNK